MDFFPFVQKWNLYIEQDTSGNKKERNVEIFSFKTAPAVSTQSSVKKKKKNWWKSVGSLPL